MLFLLKVWRDLGASERSIEFMLSLRVARPTQFWLAITEEI